MKWKIVLPIMLIMLLVGCIQPNKPEDTIKKFVEYLEYQDYELIYDEIIDNETQKSFLTKTIFINTLSELFRNYNSANIDCKEISNDGKNAKLYCNHKYKNVYGTEMEESIKYNLIKEDNSWKLII